MLPQTVKKLKINTKLYIVPIIAVHTQAISFFTSLILLGKYNNFPDGLVQTCHAHQL